MKYELAKTLTIALVQFIDRERPEGTMCCSNSECERIEKAFVDDRLDIVDGFIQRKLSKLTEFEEKLVSFALQCGGQWDLANREAKKWSREFIDLAKKELFNTNKAKGDVDLTDLYHKEYRMNPEPFPREIAHKFPECYTDVLIPSDTQSGTSTLKAEG